MKVFEHAESFTLSDARVAVCGDWHGNLGWLRTLAPAIRTLAPEVTTVLQLGDWWMDPPVSDRIFGDAGIERVLVTLGNHEPWPAVTSALSIRLGAAVRISECTWLLPRPFRFDIHGRRVLSLGGASSVDRAWRTPGRDWWPDEAITDEHVTAAIAGGSAEVMLTHETPDGSPVRAVQDVLRSNPHAFPQQPLLESAASRTRISRVWDAVHAQILLHGHMHTRGDGVTDDGRCVISLGRDTQPGHLAFLDLATLNIETPTLAQIRDASRHE